MRDISYLRKKNAMYYITSLLKNKSEIELMGDIAENTTPNFLHDDFNLLVLLSLVVAILSLVYAIATYTAQKKTEGNTKKLSRDAQRSLLNDLIRHMYRNLIIGYAIHTKLDETLWKTYPSEEHLIKLKIPLENIHLDVFYGDDNAFRAMHELYLNMRNYNEEIDVVLAHFSSAAIDFDHVGQRAGRKGEDLGIVQARRRGRIQVFLVRRRDVYILIVDTGTKKRSYFGKRFQIRSSQGLPPERREDRAAVYAARCDRDPGIHACRHQRDGQVFDARRGRGDGRADRARQHLSSLSAPRTRTRSKGGRLAQVYELGQAHLD